MLATLDRIKVDHATARKNRDVVASSILGQVIAGCAARGQKLTRSLTDDEVAAVVQRLIRQIDQALPAARTMEQALRRQKELLLPYLPQVLDEDELAEIVMRQNSIMNSHQIAAFLQKRYPGRYDPDIASKIIKDVTS